MSKNGQLHDVIFSCPFCGGEGHVQRWIDSYFVECKCCNSKGKSFSFDTNKLKNFTTKGEFYWSYEEKNYYFKILNEKIDEVSKKAINAWNVRNEI